MSKIKETLQEKIEYFLENKDRIPDEFFVQTQGGKYRVVWFLDRQRPSIESSYDFDEERFGVTHDGRIIWGFDSGCSCPSPWSSGDFGDAYDTREWKEFCVDAETKNEKKGEDDYSRDWFDSTWQEETLDNLNDYLLLLDENLPPEDVLKIKNSEVRRYLIKRVGYEKIKFAVKAVVLHKDGDNELLRFENGEMYVKVKDTSTEREYLLYVEGKHETCKSAIAWTFGLTESEYNPIIES